MQLCSSLSILWHCLSLGLEWKLTFSSPVATAEFSKVYCDLSDWTELNCDPHKFFGIVNKAEIDVFLELPCFFNDPADVGKLISGSSALSKTSLNIWKFTIHVLLKPDLGNFEHYFTGMWGECSQCGSLNILWHCLSLGLEWKHSFSSPVATAEFSKFAVILSVALSQCHLSGFERAPLEFHHLH